jgi:uncharacterized protein YndB with AHSA1/START domain
MSDRNVIVDVTIAAPVDEVWRYLRDPELVRRWHGWEYDGLDDEIRAIYVDGAQPDEAAHRLGFAGVDTTFELEESGAGRTRLRVTEPAAAGGEEFDEIAEGWITFVHQLAFALEEHPAEERRTRQLAAAEFDVAPGAPGQAFEATAPWGDRLSGTVRYRTANQVGLRVEQFGDGLLVLHYPPGGGGRAILTLYG